MSDLIERKSIRNLYSCLNPDDRVRAEQVVTDIDAIPPAEPSWTDALAELHDRFDALEKEIRKASAEMSAIIRTNLDRPQGEWVDAEIPLESGDTMPIQVCNLCKTFYLLAYTGGGHRFCPNCGARMKGADDE